MPSRDTAIRVRVRHRLLFSCLLLLFGASSAACASGAPKIKPTAGTFRGNGDSVTPKFAVAPGWEIQWTTEGGQFRIAGTGSRNLGVVVDRTQAGGGSTFPLGSGTFRLRVTAKAPWTITVINHTTK